MDEGETKICENCKREIPAVNFTIHGVYCLRNIRICPVCKEPVPNAELRQHHDKMHKLLPCEQCGESVCGTDMEDHVRDSCAYTMKCCKFCLLELRRGALPAHERYCGARTEPCACGRRVMLEYRALHLDSNHGFLRLHDDPEPVGGDLVANGPGPTSRLQPAAAPSDAINTSRPAAPPASTGRPQQADRTPVNSVIGNGISSTEPADAASGSGGAAASGSGGAAASGSGGAAASGSGGAAASGSGGAAADSGARHEAVPRSERGAARPQANADQFQKNSRASRGAVKKRPAPKPPGGPPPEPPTAPLEPVLRSALQRRQREDEQRRDQTARNLAAGLPPVLSAADKLDRLRRLDAVHRLEPCERDYRHCLTGRIWMPPEAEAGRALGAAGEPSAAARGLEPQRRRADLKDLKPMTPREFMDRCDELRLRKEPREAGVRGADRFGQIKSSLRELRRGLNEVTAPYSSGAGGDANHNAAPGDERLPCEFCGSPVPADRLVLHQTGCRPDLAQLRPRERPAREPPVREPPGPRTGPTPGPRAGPPPPLIPCEFCAAPLPVHLVSEHQERCARDEALLFPD